MKIKCKKPHKIILTFNVEIEIDGINYNIEVTFEVFPDIKNKKDRIKCIHIVFDNIPEVKYHKSISEYIESKYNYWYKKLYRYIRDIDDASDKLEFDPEIDD